MRLLVGIRAVLKMAKRFREAENGIGFWESVGHAYKFMSERGKP